MKEESQIEDMLLNLAVNARDAMPAGGSFVVASCNTELSASEVRYTDLAPGRYVTLRVSDTGCGIEPADLPHVFEPFFTTKDVGKGTGLGLATVHAAINQFGGTIEVRSELGRGAQFTIHLPEETRPLEPEPARVSTPARVGRETVLVVEDEAVVRQFLRESLSRNGFRVLEAENGRAALEVVEQYPGTIDLLVSDVTMPEMGGEDLARAVLGRRPRLRVLFITGYGGSAPEIGGLSGSAIEVVAKPVSPEVLISKIRNLLDSES